jgi:heme-degrading monooxygenase HmoA
MWMNHTITRGTPENINTAVRLLDTPEVTDAFRNAPGFRAIYLVVNLDDPGEVISISVWDSAEEGRAFYASDVYKRIFGGVVHLVSEPPFHKQFDVRIENVPEVSLA